MPTASRPPSFRPGAAGGFAEIGTASSFSFLRGASQPDELVIAARALGLAGLGLADRNTVAGVVRAHQAAREVGFAFAPGARLVFKDGTPDIFAYPRDRAGWGRLCRLLSLGNLRTVKGDCVLHLADLLDGGEGLHLALLAPDGLGASDNAAAQAAIDTAKACLLAVRENFAGAVHLAAAPRHDGADARRLARAAHLAAESRVPLMATNDVFYHVPDRRRMQDVLTAIRHHVAIPEAGLHPLEERRAAPEDPGGDGGAVPRPSRRARRERAILLGARLRSVLAAVRISRRGARARRHARRGAAAPRL